ncbi:MAG TPA: metal ABC transporter permease, partial [Myxococcota bacterium]|nr:metal ABC transporter permease [Myxococcota bacterium]
MGEGTTVQAFFEAWDLFREAALSGAAAGALLGWLGVYVVLRRMVFLSAALSQAAGFGVTLAFFAQVYGGVPASIASPTLGAAFTTLLATAGVMVDRSPTGARRDSILGCIYLVGAAGALVVGTRIVQELQDIETVLFGSAVAVLPEQFRLLVLLVLGLLGLH